jgi:hypothetical protein
MSRAFFIRRAFGIFNLEFLWLLVLRFLVLDLRYYLLIINLMHRLLKSRKKSIDHSQIVGALRYFVYHCN